nr:unnamed protein product [Digitaria exilis]
MAAGPEDEPPFSPSDFLDLPPTPCLEEGNDNLVPPFIARVLMEDEDIDDDHPALLKVQQPFAEILSAGSAFAANDATWPYDPVELSQMLLLSNSRTQPPPSMGAHCDGQNRVTMEMLNQAFLKGMEEANKFLPKSNNSFLTDTSIDRLSMSQQAANNDTRGRKNRRHDINWDHVLEAETGRNCKLMAPDTEEATEMVDEFIQNGYQSLLDRMMDLSISMDRETEKNARKKKSTSEAVDLRTLLIHCAQAVATGDRHAATELIREMKQRSSPRGDATQRLAHCFTQGLEARLAGTGARRVSAVEFHKAYQLYMAVCCFQMMAFKFSNITICKAIAGRKKVHIVDYGGAPEVRITGIDFPRPGFRPAARVEQTGRRLSNFARQCGIPFKFSSIVAKWETIVVDDLNIEPDEVLIVNGLFHFGTLSDEGGDIDSPSPRDMVLKNIQRMRPDVFILCIENSSYKAPFFVTRFREALFYYSSMFDMMDAIAPRDDTERMLVEQELFGRCALNAIACEGTDRVERPETYRQWQVRNDRAGLRQLPLDPDVVKAIKKKVKDGYHKDFFIDVDQQWLLQGWKGRTLYAMSTWVAN